ncbi:WhiB family transcriptional regulator [Amycolatopsis thailandensis]
MNPIEDIFANRPKWMDDGICSQTDPEEFYPKKGGPTRFAKAICARCPVIADCLQYALDNNEHFGIWGGMTERERHRLEHGRLRPQEDPVVIEEVLGLASAGLSQNKIAVRVGKSRWAVGQIILMARNEAA